MKTLIKYLFLASVIVLGACEPNLDTEGISRITNFPDFTVQGAPTILLHTGDPFTEPGVAAKAGGVDINVDIATLGNYFGGTVPSVNTSAPDRYTIKYSAKNSDGFSGEVLRDVFVASNGNLTSDISGLYSSTVVRNGVVAAQYTDMEYVIIKKTGTNTYVLSDIICGYYDYGRNLGSVYAGPSSPITVNNLATNDFTFGAPVPIRTFGGSAEITEMEVDAANKQIKIVTEWDFGYTFEITLTQVTF